MFVFPHTQGFPRSTAATAAPTREYTGTYGHLQGVIWRHFARLMATASRGWNQYSMPPAHFITISPLLAISS